MLSFLLIHLNILVDTSYPSSCRLDAPTLVNRYLTIPVTFRFIEVEEQAETLFHNVHFTVLKLRPQAQ